ncbi:MAG: FecR domain-containing protein [Acetobacteraceae bacterium]|nr:FecR domain-containing protein [Acetobacteraceae bacterium]
MRVGDTVNVPARCNLKLRLTNGSEILLSSGSRMSILSYSAGGTDTHVNLTLTQGLLQAVLPSTSGSPSFEISTPVGTASVRSGPANWFVYSQADSAQVGVLEGTVDLTSAATRRSVSIPAHWGTRLESNRDPVLLRVWPENQFDGFRRLTQ